MASPRPSPGLAQSQLPPAIQTSLLALPGAAGNQCGFWELLGHQARADHVASCARLKGKRSAASKLLPFEPIKRGARAHNEHFYYEAR